MIIGWNGRCVPEQEAVVSVLDHGFLYGVGLFETFRTYGGEPFLLERHVDRLQAGCRDAGIRLRLETDKLRAEVRAVLAANGLADGYVRYSVSAGVEPLGLPSGDYERPNTFVYAKPLPPAPVPAPVHGDSALPPPSGKSLHVLRTPRNTPEGAVRAKSFHYMNNILGKRELLQQPGSAGAEGLFLSANGGYVAEGLVSNVLFVAGGKLCTPALETGILPGITRAHVLELARKDGVPTEEGLYTLEDMLAATEIILTNSVQELTPVAAVRDADGRQLWSARSTGADATVCARLGALYRSSVDAYVARSRRGD